MMLRRKMVLILGSLVVLLLATAVGAIWMLQGVLHDLRHLDAEAWTVIEQANRLGTTISLVEIELYEIEQGRQRHLDRIIDSVELMEQQLEKVAASYVARLPENSPLVDRIRARLPLFARHVAALGIAQDLDWANQHRREAMIVAYGLRQDIFALGRNIGTHGEREQAEITSRFRWLVLGLTAMFLLLINTSIIVLLRTTGMILKPVEKLIAATQELARERFDFRVDLEQNDEFDQLARAYNNLAGQLQVNEQRKLETLQQVALTLSHELNNAAAIIELQLQLLDRQSGGNPALEKCARQIHDSLGRMTRTVELLKQIRRIVLTDYVSGVKMLDLEKSATTDELTALRGHS